MFDPNALPGMRDEPTREHEHRGAIYVISQAHPVADALRWMREDEIDALAADIGEIGLKHKIQRLPDGRILDGRNRELACRIAGIEPEYEPVNPTEDAIPGEVASLNLLRRHLTTDERRAWVNLLRERGYSVREIAGLIGVGKSTVARDLSPGDAKSSRENQTDKKPSVPNGTLQPGGEREQGRFGETDPAGGSGEGALGTGGSGTQGGEPVAGEPDVGASHGGLSGASGGRGKGRAGSEAEPPGRGPDEICAYAQNPPALEEPTPHRYVALANKVVQLTAEVTSELRGDDDAAKNLCYLLSDVAGAVRWKRADQSDDEAVDVPGTGGVWVPCFVQLSGFPYLIKLAAEKGRANKRTAAYQFGIKSGGILSRYAQRRADEKKRNKGGEKK